MMQLPAMLWQRVQAFIEQGRTGTISLNLNRGRIESWDIREHEKNVAAVDSRSDIVVK